MRPERSITSQVLGLIQADAMPAGSRFHEALVEGSGNPVPCRTAAATRNTSTLRNFKKISGILKS